MSKLIFEGKSLTIINRNQDGKYAVGDSIDPFRDLGYIKPSFTKTSVGTPDATIKDVARRNSTMAFAINAGKIYEIKNQVFNITDYSGTFAVGSTPGYVPTGLGNGASLVFYPNADNMYYIGKDKLGKTVFTDPTCSMVDDYLTLSGASAFSASTDFRPHAIWNGFLMIGDGRYLVKFVDPFGGGGFGTFTMQYFDIGVAFTIVSLFTYSGYLGMVVKPISGDYQSEIILIDGSSATAAVKRFTVDEKVTVAKNFGNSLVFFTEDIAGKCWIKQMGSDGLDNENAIEIRLENASTGALESFSAPTRYSEVDVYDNKVAFAAGSYVFVLGNSILSKPFKPTGTTITAVKLADNGNLYVASYTGTTYYFEVFSTGNSTAVLKYPYHDFGQNVRINYLKYFFKPLVSGDALTAGLEKNYGTSVSLGMGANNISYTKDGVITSKRFDLKEICHSVRPILSWVTGGASLSYVECDYSEVDDI
jgi:hypothetical protein